jgi:ComF family protein
VICVACQPHLPVNDPACYRCGLPLDSSSCLDPETICEDCFQRPPPFLSCIAPLLYHFPVNQLIAHMKYSQRPQFTRLLVDLAMARFNQTAERPLPEVLIPVPMHPVRQRQRGFNQAIYLARHLGRELNIPVLADALLKTRTTEAQNPLSAQARRSNLADAFRINPRREKKLASYHSVGLVDDVITTAATVTEISNLLKNAGFAEIHLLAIARTP